jgi:putative spermidine/putrescine transport system ATP-binding protein
MTRSPDAAPSQGKSPTRGAIVVEQATKVYPGHSTAAIAGISLTVEPGEFISFLGPSGAGKTTTLSAIAGLTSLTGGRIRLDGRDVSTIRAHQRDLGVVFQNYALFPHMTAAQNIAFPLKQRRLAGPETVRLVAEALDMVHLRPLADRKPHQLSAGQQQRVALARALVYRPRAMLMDEPLSALDKHLREYLGQEIARIHRDLRMTFVFVTHDHQEAMALSDRIVVFNNGRIEQVGTPRSLYEHPATLFTAQFIGGSTVLPATLTPDGRLICAGFTLRAPAGGPAVPAGPVVAVVRAEHIHLQDTAAPPPVDRNQVEVLVVEAVYAGDHYLVRVQFPDATRGSALWPTGVALPGLPGQTVRASWDPEHQALVPQPPADAPGVS